MALLIAWLKNSLKNPLKINTLLQKALPWVRKTEKKDKAELIGGFQFTERQTIVQAD